MKTNWLLWSFWKMTLEFIVMEVWTFQRFLETTTKDGRTKWLAPAWRRISVNGDLCFKRIQKPCQIHKNGKAPCDVSLKLSNKRIRFLKLNRQVNGKREMRASEGIEVYISASKVNSKCFASLISISWKTFSLLNPPINQPSIFENRFNNIYSTEITG